MKRIKITTFFLAMLLLLSSCSKKIDAEDAYNNLVDTLKYADSLEIESVIVSKNSSAPGNITTKVKVSLLRSGANTTMVMDRNTVDTTLGTTTVSIVYKNGIMYQQNLSQHKEGAKIALAIPFDDLLNELTGIGVGFYSTDDIQNLSGQKISDESSNTSITFTPTEVSAGSLMLNALRSQLISLKADGDNTTFGNVSYMALVNKDNLPINETITFNTKTQTSNGEYSSDHSISVDYIGINTLTQLDSDINADEYYFL